MSDHTQVKDETSFVRDNKSQAIVNVNNEALKAYKKKKNLDAERDARIQRLEDSINNIEKALNMLTILIKENK